MDFAFSQWIFDTSDQNINYLNEQGISFIEPGPGFLLDNEDAIIEEKAKRLCGSGLRLYSCHAPFMGINDLSQCDETNRKNAVAVF